MTNAEIITAFMEAMQSAGATPRDIAPFLGLSRATQYRILAGSRATTPHALASLRMFTKFLNWAVSSAILIDSPKFHKERATRFAEAFEIWLQEK